MHIIHKTMIDFSNIYGTVNKKCVHSQLVDISCSGSLGLGHNKMNLCLNVYSYSMTIIAEINISYLMLSYLITSFIPVLYMYHLAEI